MPESRRAIELEPGDVIHRAWYGPCRIIENSRSGNRLRKLMWLPIKDDPCRLPNPPGLDYVPNDKVIPLLGGQP